MASERVARILLAKGAPYTPEEIAAMSDREAWGWVYSAKTPKNKTSRPRRGNKPAICFTGFADDEKKKLQAEASAKFWIAQSVTSDLEFLVCGPRPGPAKLKQAAAQDVQILTLDEYRQMLETGVISESKKPAAGGNSMAMLFAAFIYTVVWIIVMLFLSIAVHPLAACFIIFCHAVWAYDDAAKLRNSGQLPDTESQPATLAIGMLLLWVVVFPVWIVRRERYMKNTSNAENEARLALKTVRVWGETPVDPEPPERFPCPVCGESIPLAAKICRFCQAVITEKDRAAATITTPATDSTPPPPALPAVRQRLDSGKPTPGLKLWRAKSRR